MSTLPQPVVCYLRNVLVEQRRPAYLLVRADGSLLRSGGPLGRYGIPPLQAGEHVATRVEALAGMAPFTTTSSMMMNCVQSQGACPADVYIFHGDDGHWVVFVDATEEAERRRQVHQQANDLALLRQDPAAAAAGAGDHEEGVVPGEILATLDVLVLEFVDGGCFRAIGRVPEWFGEFFEQGTSSAGAVRPGERFPFLENFLVDALNYWATGEHGGFRSGIWFERDRAGQERALEATAVSLEQRRVLLIELMGAAYEERQFLIQKARESKLYSLQLRRAGQKLQQQKTELARSNKELEEFAYVVSHDLRAPLRAISSLALFIEQDLGEALADGVGQKIGMLRSRVRHLDQLIESLLTFARAGDVSSAPVAVDLAKLIDEVIFMLDPPAGFTVVVPEGLPVLDARPAPLKQVLQNLIGNALKHHDRPRGRVEIACKEGPCSYEISVSDDGPGIPSQDRVRIFRMFQTLQPSEETAVSGMGLALVKKIVERNGGAIEVDAGLGGGATFRFTWPKTSQ